MRFQLIDQIVELIPGKRIQAVKNLTLGEEYLADHFPTFPVMPGVLMLEALVQAGAWLWRGTSDFAHSVIVLREVRGVKYGNFVEPGKRLHLTVEAVDQPASPTWSLKGSGEVSGIATVSAKLMLEGYNLKDCEPGLSELDDELIGYYRNVFKVLRSVSGGR